MLLTLIAVLAALVLGYCLARVTKRAPLPVADVDDPFADAARVTKRAPLPVADVDEPFDDAVTQRIDAVEMRALRDSSRPGRALTPLALRASGYSVVDDSPERKPRKGAARR